MTTAKTHSVHCTKCNEQMPQVSVYSRPMQIAFRAWQIIIFIFSFGMVYPHTFSPDDEFAVKCTKCGIHSMLAYKQPASSWLIGSK